MNLWLSIINLNFLTVSGFSDLPFFILNKVLVLYYLYFYYKIETVAKATCLHRKETHGYLPELATTKSGNTYWKSS